MTVLPAPKLNCPPQSTPQVLYPARFWKQIMPSVLKHFTKLKTLLRGYCACRHKLHHDVVLAGGTASGVLANCFCDGAQRAYPAGHFAGTRSKLVPNAAHPAFHTRIWMLHYANKRFPCCLWGSLRDTAARIVLIPSPWAAGSVERS